MKWFKWLTKPVAVQQRVDLANVVFDESGVWGVQIKIVEDDGVVEEVNVPAHIARQLSDGMRYLADCADEMNNRTLQ